MTLTPYPHPLGADRRRGVFRAGERVQITDVKGRKYTTMLTNNGYFQSTRGSFRHSELIGREEGTVIDTHDGYRLLALRPLVGDYVLSMPRGATVIYPKDAGQIIHQADIFPGARVFEAGVGSGALSLSLLAAVGMDGQLISVERRPEFAEIARANVESWYGAQMPPWEVVVGDAADVLSELAPGSIDVVVLDMLAPWENIDPAAHALRSGGVILAYVATTTQMSRFVETLRSSSMYTEPEANETMLRTWHLDGLAVRPDHRMVAHTGFLVVARKIASDSQPLVPKRRPAPAAHSEALDWEREWESADFGERTISAKKLRKVRRDVAHRADVETTGDDAPGLHSEEIAQQLDAEAHERVANRLNRVASRLTEQE
ncbi:MAG: tRNA (adenine-N1)-methyltransferase [Actinomycetaceae bacterium]|nr:tRNA (adenine-N1)-methyltransferase [Arcanobacterium sp.]MDD7504462.1 tRNA (adenine-N1)-methyltransferase [Actinomycetaceae bacterium]MDY6143980.1 tRNA (adenine-N1)-methyltransferase [Arcanobacterium sp.]